MFSMMRRTSILFTLLLSPLFSIAATPVMTVQLQGSATTSLVQSQTGSANYLVTLNPNVPGQLKNLSLKAGVPAGVTQVTTGSSECSGSSTVCQSAFSLKPGRTCCLMLRFTGSQMALGSNLVAPLIATTPQTYKGQASVLKVQVSATPYFTVGGTTSGLGGGDTVVLQNNGTDNLAVSANGAFTFPTSIGEGSPYRVTVLTQPAGKTCSVAFGTGTITTANVTNVVVTCSATTYTVGGSVSGLAAGQSVVLQNLDDSGGDAQTVSSNTTFTFSQAVANQSPYAVVVKTQPTGQYCSVTNGTGIVNGANVTNVLVTCVNTYTVGGNVSGLEADERVVLLNNGTDRLTVSANAPFTFSTALPTGSAYQVTVGSAPDGKTCSVAAGTGTISNANVTNVVVTCSAITYTVGGSVTGLAAGQSVVLQNLDDSASDAQTVSSNTTFTFAKPVANQSTYVVTVKNQPVGQVCTVTNGTGTINSANVTNVLVTCVNTYTIGGTVSGLGVGQNIVLQNNGTNNLTVTADGAFTFTNPIVEGNAYSVTILTPPAGRTCSVSFGAGTVTTADVTSVTVRCSLTSYTVGGTISGLVGTVVLQNLDNSAGDALTKTTNGAFTFPVPVANNSNYAVSVITQPAGQICTVSTLTASGIIRSANVTNVAVTCTNAYTVGGTVTGLSGSVTLTNNNGNPLVINADGSFAFSTPVAQGSAYAVAVSAQPAEQTCTVSNGSGVMGGANVTSVTVNCAEHTYSVGGTATGLATGARVYLNNNGGNTLVVGANGAFTFTTPVADTGGYAVTISQQPGYPPVAQTCVVTNGTGTVNGANVTSVILTCTTNTYSVGGTVTGLTTTGLILKNNGGDDLPVSASGSFTFSTSVASGDAYDVTIFAQPTTQTCSISNNRGDVGAAAITSVVIHCATNTYTIGGTVSGLSGSGLVLQNNKADNLPISANGSFTFSTPIADGANYDVTVRDEPNTPTQTCSVGPGAAGVVNGVNVSNIAVTCATDAYDINVNVSGLNGTLVLTNNDTDDLTTSTDGNLAFSKKIASGGTYQVKIKTQPADQTCSISTTTASSGTVTGASPPTIVVGCSTNDHTLGGTITGLTGTVVLQNGGQTLSRSANGAFTFSTPIAEGTYYAVTVSSQPVGQICSVANGTGQIGGADVTSVAVTCDTQSYSIGGTITGLTGTVVLQNNGGNNLSTSSSSFTFSSDVANGGAYAVTVLTQPTEQFCQVISGGTGTVSGANVTNVSISCDSTTTTITVDANGIIPVSNSGLTSSITVSNNSFINPAYNVTLTLPAGWSGASVNNSDCAVIPPNGSCQILFSSTLPYTPQGNIIVAGSNTQQATTALATSVVSPYSSSTPDARYLVFAVSGNKVSVIFTSDQNYTTTIGTGLFVWDLNDDAVSGVSETSVAGGGNCNGATEGPCNTQAITELSGLTFAYEVAAIQCWYNQSPLPTTYLSSGAWYLPATCQLAGGNVGSSSCSSLPGYTGNIDSLFQLGFGGLIAAGQYWSSTDSSENSANAWNEIFNFGNASTRSPVDKSNPPPAGGIFVRCVQDIYSS